MTFLPHRPRRLRRLPALREMVAQTTIKPAQMVLPVFVREGHVSPKPVSSLPGVSQHSLESLDTVVDEAIEAGLAGVMIFGIPLERDDTGDQALSESNILHEAVRQASTRARGRLAVMADVCLDEFTSHGHCGVLNASGSVDNDLSTSLYGRMAVSLARAGADVMGLSGMMDGQVGVVREALDAAGYVDTVILAYSAKFASSFYGPFRDAVESSLEGDRTTYQQDYRNPREAKKEILLDLEQGADIIMVKPAWSYLDILRDAAQMSDVPMAAYVVSGEHAMLESAATQGIVDRQAAIRELLLSVRRAGADVIFTYWALEAASWTKEEQW